MRPILLCALLREHSHLGTCRAAVVVELLEVLQRQHAFTVSPFLLPPINFFQVRRVGVVRFIVLNDFLLLEDLQLTLTLPV